MDLRLSVVAPGARAPVDLRVSAPAGSRLGSVAGHVRAAAGGDGSLYVAGVPLGDAAQLGTPPLLHGALVTVGDPGLRQRPRGLLQLRVVGGPDAGAIHHVDPGVVRVGRAIGNDIRLDDPDVSRTHAELTIGWDSVGVRDLGSTNGTTVGGRRVSDEVVPLSLGVPLRVGSSTLVLAMPVLSPAATRPDGVGRLEFNRPPRIRHHSEGTEISLPAEPRVRERTRFPLVAVLLPLVLAGVLVAVFRRPEFVVFAALSPLLLGSQWVGDRLVQRREARGAWAEYERAVATARARLASAVAEESAAARSRAPDLADVLATVDPPTAMLWHRRPGDADWLLVRLGTADQPSTVRIRSPTPERVAAVGPPMLPDAPVTVALHEVGVLGLAGARHRVLGLARAMVVQLAVLHSPRDLLLVLLAPGERAADWAWARWLPHLAPVDGQDCAALLGLDDAQAVTRVRELSALVEARREVTADRAPWPRPHTVVVLDGARALRSVPGVASLLARGGSAGVHAICLDERGEDLPAECRARAVLEGASSTTLRTEVDGRAPVTDGTVDAVSLRWAERVARMLAPLRDATPGDTGADRLPDTVRWLDIVGGRTAADPPTAQEVAAAWRASPRSTAAPIGVGADGAFTVDLRRDGPHALVAGTTGSGKSELLQTLVVSLALGNRPDEMCFVLIDYKGGAAFAECARLPHVAGLVTDLDGHLTRRALTSLDAELKRREQILGSLGAVDLDAFHATAAPGSPPMPRLVIVVDEFAALVQELPDFVRGLVAVAQRGRSLGVHLVLATQRPAGVVSSEIRANTGLRIALRVNDAAESDDVVGCEAAASIPRRLPGRAIARAGAEPAVAFQTARVGGRGATARGPLVEAAPWSGLGNPLPRTGDAADDGPSDLARVVEVLADASAFQSVPLVPSPWLPPLPDQVSVRNLPVAPASGGLLPPLPYGVLDVPAEQARRTLALDLQVGGHLIAAGGPRSGRSTLLRTVALQVAQHCCTSDVHLYGIDVGDGALLPLTALPQCGAVIAVDQVERVARLLERLGDEIQRRQAILARAGHADAAEQRSDATPEERLPYLLVLLDRWEGFLTALDEVDAGRLIEAVLGLLRDGLAVGLRMVVTGDRSVLVGRLASLVEDTLVLRMPNRADAALVGLQLRDLPDRQGPGRAVLAPAGLEAQLALPGDDASGPGQITRLREVAATASLRDAAVPAHLRPFRIAALPEVVGYDELLIPDRPVLAGPWALVGIGGDEAGPLGVDLGTDSGPTFVAGGPPGSGRSTALVVMAVSVLATGGQVVLVAPRPSPLRRLAGRSGVLAVLTGGVGNDARLQLEVTAAAAIGPLVVLVDDAELVVDSALGAVLGDYLSSCRDGGSALVLAGSTTDLQAGFRGVAAEARKGRTGLLLSPEGALDGDLLGVRLPRSLVAPGPRGRGVLVVRGALTAVQVPFLVPAPPC
jgi:DNA segregation ATPase FtsK/SpoIIIE, S-DNA-T family